MLRLIEHAGITQNVSQRIVRKRIVRTPRHQVSGTPISLVQLSHLHFIRRQKTGGTNPSWLSVRARALISPFGDQRTLSRKRSP